MSGLPNLASEAALHPTADGVADVAAGGDATVVCVGAGDGLLPHAVTQSAGAFRRMLILPGNRMHPDQQFRPCAAPTTPGGEFVLGEFLKVGDHLHVEVTQLGFLVSHHLSQGGSRNQTTLGMQTGMVANGTEMSVRNRRLTS